jgi:hypothetical protein
MMADVRVQQDEHAGGLAQCVPLGTQILTRRGWLRHDQVQIGDETLGYNLRTGRSEWTRITKVVHHEEGDIWRIGTRQWHVEVTPNHRWWSDTETQITAGQATCPECGWVPRGAKFPARGVQVHRNKIHGVPPGLPEHRFRGEFIRTDQMHGGHRLRLAAPADTEGVPGLSLEDVRVIAWLQGDGHMSPVLAKPEICPECGWQPGSERHNRNPRQPANSVAVHRAKQHGMGKHQTRGELAGYDGSIYQSKPAMIMKLRTLLAGIEHAESIRHRGGNTQPAHQFRLRRAYVTDLIKRSRVLDMSLGDTSAEIIEFVRQRPEGVYAREVVEKFGKDAYQYLKRLTQAGRIDKAGRGLYIAPYTPCQNRQ